MKYRKKAFVWLTYFRVPDISLGLHVCWDGRVDFHFLLWMLSIGNVPIYEDSRGKLFAVSNSYHKTRKGPLRAGTQ